MKTALGLQRPEEVRAAEPRLELRFGYLEKLPPITPENDTSLPWAGVVQRKLAAGIV